MNESGTPKNARKYSEAVSSSIRREVTRRQSAHDSATSRLRAEPSAASLALVEDIDRRILTLLAADGRMSFTDLGKATGLSTSAVHQRVKRLEQRGLITGVRRGPSTTTRSACR